MVIHIKAISVVDIGKPQDLDESPPKPPKDPPKRKYGSLRDLSSEHRAAVDSFLISGHPIDKIVEIIKNEWKELPDSNPEAVRRMLYRYRESSIYPKQAQLAAKFGTSKGLSKLSAAVTALEARLDPVVALESLVIQQHKRVEKMAKLEEKAPTLLEVQTKNISLMGDLLMKLVDVQMETGILRRVSKKLDVQTVDISLEERDFIENAKVVNAQTGFVVDALRLLRSSGTIAAPPLVVNNAD